MTSKKNVYFKKLLFLVVLACCAAALYQFTDVDINFFSFAMRIRGPRLAAMFLASFCVGVASILFQTIINNVIVTPCLLGMNALYVLIHTSVVFLIGSGSKLSVNSPISFVVDLLSMAVVAVLIYGYLFQKAGGNILYILLVGSVLTTLFSSISTTMQRMMDPNEFDQLQNSLIASFERVNADAIWIAVMAILILVVWLWRQFPLLDVLVLGKHQAINLGVDYEKVSRKMLVGVTILIGIATALVGPISFLGLIIANLSRQLFKTYQHRYLTFGAALVGMVILFAGQTLVEQVFHFGANINAFINIGGGAYFLYLLLRGEKQ
ncbi:MAG: iron chelate uptake ABC transporter family permease subunit [Oscillospiraceae bacterium]|nr:iron chelate uptake ABC transporter family permease subunit [Oscillospiraceae bacterium]